MGFFSDIQIIPCFRDKLFYSLITFERQILHILCTEKSDIKIDTHMSFDRIKREK